MAQELSLQEFAGTGESPEPTQKPAGEVSFEEFAGKKLPGKESEVISTALKYLKATGGEAAALTDLVLSLPGFVIGTGAELSAAAVGTIAHGAEQTSVVGAEGPRQPENKAFKEGREIGTGVQEYLGNPLRKLLNMFEQGDVMDQTATTYGMKKFGSLIDEAGKWVEDSTGGRVPKESVPMLVDTLMVGIAGIRPRPRIKETGVENRATYSTPEEIKDAGPQRTAQQDIVDSLNIKTTQEREAFNKQRRADVRAAFKEDPDYADYLKYLADERSGYGKGYPNASGLGPAASAEAKPRLKAKSTPEQMGPEPIQIGTAADRRETPYSNLPGGNETLGKLPTKEELTAGAEFPHEEFKFSELDEVVQKRLLDKIEEVHAEIMRTGTPEEKARVSQYIKSHKLEIAAAGGIAAYLAANPEDAKEVGLLGGALLAVKGKGGMWHPEAVERLSAPLWEALTRAPEHYGERAGHEAWQKGREDLAERMVKNYLNKYAGTKEDPLAQVEIPSSKLPVDSWGNIFDQAIGVKPAKMYEGLQPKGSKPEEPIYNIAKKGADFGNTVSAARDIENYLSHVGDYLRQKVSPEKLQQYDLVRAVKETKKWDEELAKAMEKQASDLSKMMPVYKEYPDGFKWVEVRAKDGDSALTKKLLEQEGDMMGHCVGGYCDMVTSGEGKIYSLRDKKGRSHVTIEVEPSHINRMGSETELPDIRQIKGKQNRAPAPEYLPYVQDFVKSGKWGEVGDLHNADMVKNDLGQYVPRPRREITPPAGERGSVDPKLLARMAAVGVGAVAGTFIDPDHPFKSAILGALTGAAISHISPRGVVQAIQAASKPGKLLKIDELMNATQYARRAAGRVLWQLQTQVEELVPNAARRGAISHWLEGDTSIQLSPKELAAATKVKQFFASAGEAGLNSGTLKDLIENYVTHVYGREHKGLIDEIMNRSMRPNMSPNTPFAQKRTGPPTIREINALAKQKGIAPITDDISAVVGIYGNSLSRAMENRKFIQTLRATKSPEGQALVSPTYVEGYKTIQHPQLNGQWVHPDIVPDLRMVFDANDPGVVMRSLEAINTTQKRMAVSFSLFHAKALEDAMLGADRLMKAPGRVIKSLAQAALPSVFGKNRFLKQLKEGGAGDLVDRSQKAGLEFSLERQGPAIQELRQGFYESLKGAQKFLDNTIPGAGKVAEGFAKANHAFDNFMWGRLHAGLKLELFADKTAELQRNNAAAAEANPGKVKLKSQAEVDRIAASFTNDIFGGLNWQRLVQEAQTRWGKQLSSALLSPTGRSVTRLLLFAPDWTISTTRAALKAFGKGSGVKGLVKPTELADLHRQYILRSAFWYAIIGDSINYAMSGHHLWENKDPTRLDVGDGRTMQWSKHTMEPVHWLTMPRQQALNKLGAIPKTAAEVALNKEYLSTGSAPNMKDNALVHTAKKLSPIAVGQSFEGGAESGAAGFFGMPIYGKTKAEREAIKARRKLEREFKGGMTGSRG